MEQSHGSRVVVISLQLPELWLAVCGDLIDLTTPPRDSDGLHGNAALHERLDVIGGEMSE